MEDIISIVMPLLSKPLPFMTYLLKSLLTPMFLVFYFVFFNFLKSKYLLLRHFSSQNL